jgi:TolA-binding protein
MKKIAWIGCLALLTLTSEGLCSGVSMRSLAVIVRIVERHEASLAYAYESSFKTRASWPEVKAIVLFDITAEGDVKNVEIVSTEGFDALPGGPALSVTFVDKMTEAAYSWKFPPVSAGVTTVEIPLSFVAVTREEKEIARSKSAFKDSWECGERVDREGKVVYVTKEFFVECTQETAIPLSFARATPRGDIFKKAAKAEVEKPAREFLEDVGRYFDERREPAAANLTKKLGTRERQLGEMETALGEEELRGAAAGLGLSDKYDWDVKRPDLKKVAKLREKRERLSGEIEKLNREISAAEETWSRSLADKRAALIARGEKLLDDVRSRGGGPWLFFALAEMYLDSGEGTKAAELFEPVIETAEPEIRSEALYGLGHAYLLSDGGEKAPKAFLRLARDYPESPHVAEAYFRLGDYFEQQREPLKAEKYFVLAAENDEGYRDAALYEAGWAFYECSGPSGADYYDRAVPAFKRFLGEAEEGSPYCDHALEMTGVCLAEWEPGTAERPPPLDALIGYDETFGGAEERPYSADVLRALGDAYLYKMDKLPEAAATYEYLLGKYPSYGDAPGVIQSKVESNLRREAYDDAHAARLRLVDEYGPASSWYRAQYEPTRCRALLSWEKALYEVGVYFNMQAERKIRTHPEEGQTLYGNAIDRYNQYLTSFPTNEKAYHINFYFAECYFEVEDYENAAKQYIKTATHYTDPVRYKIDEWDERFTQEQSLYNSLVAYDEMYWKEISGEEGEGILLNSPNRLTVRPLTATETKFVEACTEFAARYPESEEIPTVLSKTGEIYSQAYDYKRAREYYVRLVNEYPEPVEESDKKDHDTLYVYALISIANTYSKEADILTVAGDIDSAAEKRAEYEAWLERAETEAKSRGVDFEDLINLIGER